MRRRVELEAMIDHPVERVFAYLADPSRWHLFAPAVAFRRKMDAGPQRIGTRWVAADGFGPFKVHFVDELVEMEAGRRVVWASSAPWNARTEYVCEPAADGTRIRARYEGDVAGWLRLLAWIPTPMIAAILSRDFRRLGRRLAEDARWEAERGGAEPRISLRRQRRGPAPH